MIFCTWLKHIWNTVFRFRWSILEKNLEALSFRDIWKAYHMKISWKNSNNIPVKTFDETKQFSLNSWAIIKRNETFHIILLAASYPLFRNYSKSNLLLIFWKIYSILFKCHKPAKEILTLRVKVETEWMPIKTITLVIYAQSGRLNSMNSKVSSIYQLKSYLYTLMKKKRERKMQSFFHFYSALTK